MRRVNIYLSDKQDDNLDYLSEITGKSRSDIMRDAVDEYTDKYKTDIGEFLTDIFENSNKENHFMKEYEFNPVKFIEDNILISNIDRGIIPFKMWDFQKRIVNTLNDYNEVIITKARQTGSTSTILSYILHYLIFNKNKTIAITSARYAQAQELLKKLMEAFDSLPVHIRPAIKDKNKLGFKCNGNKIIARACSPCSVKGEKIDLLYIDEFAWVKRDVADAFIASVFPTLSSNNHKLIISSTPKDCNHFYKLWTDAISNHNNLRPIKVTYNWVPGRDERWTEKIKSEIGEERFNQEFMCQFTKEDNIAI